MKTYLQPIRNARLYTYLQHTLPTQEGTYTLMGLYAMVATYIGFYTIDAAVVEPYAGLYEVIYQSVLFATSILITFPVWPLWMKSRRFIAFFWPLSISAILFFAGTLLVIMSQIQPMQMMVLMINILVVALVLRVPMALALAISGIGLAVWFFSHYIGEALPWSELGAWQGKTAYILLLFASLLVALFNYQESLRHLNKKNKALIRLGLENRDALQVVKDASVAHLIRIAKDLQTVPEEGSLAAKLHALESELIPIAFQLQGIDARSQDYLRLQLTTFSIQQWLDKTNTKLQEKGISRIEVEKTTQQQELLGDCGQLISLLTKSVIALQGFGQQDLGESPTVLVALEDTQLSYSLPDVAQDYVKYVQALRIVVTTEASLPSLAPSYEANLAGEVTSISYNTRALAQLINSRIIKSHYGYSETTSTTFIYVIPINVKEVRPKDMDKPYIDLRTAPRRANDCFKNNQIDAQAREKAFLTAVVEHSQADIGLVEIALELMKWYHGPVERHSGEPFYLHPLSVAQIVLDYNQDEATILGALLHDIVEDTSILLQQIGMVFGQEAADVVDQITHLQRILNSPYKVRLSAEENLRMLEHFGNTRAMYIKLADRMHNMRTIEGHDSVTKQKQIAKETLQFFAPLAERLGLQQAAEEFKERCLAVLDK
ncbi:MAG: HD domain-containing protein [Bacteroidota bacterium]